MTRCDRAYSVCTSPSEIPRSVERSRPPYESIAHAGADAMSKAASTPRADSIVQSSGTPGARSATHATSSADSTLGMRNPNTDPDRAFRSRSHSAVRARLTRTQQVRVAATEATISRARSFMCGGTASSRSSRTMSAPASKTLPSSFSSWPGAKSQLRGGRIAPSRMVFTHELAGDHGPEDIVRAFPNRHQGRIPVKALDLVLGGVAVSAVDAHPLEGRLDADLGGVELRH